MVSSVTFQSIGVALVCHAGEGQWYNQPHNDIWDMGEDVADIPAAPWHLALQEAIDTQQPNLSRIIVDVTRMDWLVGQDWGFLVELHKSLAPQRMELWIVANERVRSAAALLRLDSVLRIVESLSEAIAKGSPDEAL